MTEQTGSTSPSSAGAGTAADTGPPAETIKLDQFLKLAGVARSGGDAKILIQSGQITVNGTVETRRGRKLRHGDVVIAQGEELVVISESEEDEGGRKSNR